MFYQIFTIMNKDVYINVYFCYKFSTFFRVLHFRILIGNCE